jgi:hypothetical protein
MSTIYTKNHPYTLKKTFLRLLQFYRQDNAVQLPKIERKKEETETGRVVTREP